MRQFPNAADNLAFVQNPPEAGKKYGQQGQSSGRMPAFGSYYTARAARRARQVHPEPLMSLASVLAIGWQPEIRGHHRRPHRASLVLCGSVYLILSTNLGSRLGFLVALAGLFGWLMMMGIIWWVYGIGLKGKDPSWVGQGDHRHRR